MHVAQIRASGQNYKLLLAREDIRMCDGHRSTLTALSNIFHGDLSKSSTVSHFLSAICSSVDTRIPRFNFAQMLNPIVPPLKPQGVDCGQMCT